MRLAVGEHALPGAEKEFWQAARACGAQGVELRFGPLDVGRHPLAHPGRAAALKRQAGDAGVALPSAFAGYFHDHPFTSASPGTRRQAAQTLDRLLDGCLEAGVGTLVLPLLGEAEIRTADAAIVLQDALSGFLAKAHVHQMTLALETTLPAPQQQALLQTLHHPALRLAYDLGNATLLGYDLLTDLQLLGDAVAQLRVRDVTADGRRVPLGRGAVPLPAVRSAVTGAGLDVWWILEGEDVKDLESLAKG